MRTNKLALSSSLIKRPLMALLCLGMSAAVMVSPAIAGGGTASGGIVQPLVEFINTESDTDTDSETGGLSLNEAIREALATMSGGRVTTINGQSLTLPAGKLETIVAALTASGDGFDRAISNLEGQLRGELPGIDLKISGANDVPSAVAAVNKFIRESSNPKALAESATFVALLRLLEAAQKANGSDDSENVINVLTVEAR